MRVGGVGKGGFFLFQLFPSHRPIRQEAVIVLREPSVTAFK